MPVGPCPRRARPGWRLIDCPNSMPVGERGRGCDGELTVVKVPVGKPPLDSWGDCRPLGDWLRDREHRHWRLVAASVKVRSMAKVPTMRVRT